VADVLLLSDRSEDLLDLVTGLEQGGHRVAVAALGETLGRGPDPDILLVDSVKDLARGRDVCRAVRARSARLPVVAIAAEDSLDALGPDWEIDSFIVDGASADEALARIRVALGPRAAETAGTIRVGDLSIDPETYQVRLRGRPLDLTYKEFQLLTFLAQRPGRVFSRAQLLQEVWGYDFFGGTRTVDVHVRRLRAKLGAEHESLIATVRNVGYKVEIPGRGRA
jgi:DNA-binding response OmpR family regulator